MAKSSTRLVLICGLPASGKSALARQLAPKIPAIRLDKDGWATQLGADLWDEEFRVRLEHQLWVLSQDLLARGQSVILEWGHWARVERDEKRLGARALGVGVELHYLDAPLEELIERAERRNASGEWTASPMTRAHFERWATIFQPPDEEEILLFDKPSPLPKVDLVELGSPAISSVTEVPLWARKPLQARSCPSPLDPAGIRRAEYAGPKTAASLLTRQPAKSFVLSSRTTRRVPIRSERSLSGSTLVG